MTDTVARVISGQRPVSEENKDFVNNFENKVTDLLTLLTGIQGIRRCIAQEMWKQMLPLFTAALSLHSVNKVDRAQQTDLTGHEVYSGSQKSVATLGAKTSVPTSKTNASKYASLHMSAIDANKNTSVQVSESNTNKYSFISTLEMATDRYSSVPTLETKKDKYVTVIPVFCPDDNTYNVTHPKMLNSPFENTCPPPEGIVHVQLEKDDGSQSLIQLKTHDVTNDVLKTVANNGNVVDHYEDGTQDVCSLSKGTISQNDDRKSDEDPSDTEMDNHCDDIPAVVQNKYDTTKTVNSDVYPDDGEVIKRGKGRPRKVCQYPAVLDEHGRQTFICPVCSAHLKSCHSLEVHLRKHSGQKPFSCGTCAKPFTTKGNMEQHQQVHSDKKTFQCKECHKFYKEEKILRVHMRIHTGARPYKCELCSKTFTQCGSLATHMAIHSGVKKFLCDLCGKHFRGNGQLKIHRRRHLNQRDFKCSHCDLMFVCKGELDRHVIHHSGSKPFLCNLCPKSFSRKSYLSEHLNFHSGQTPYQCTYCPSSFHDYAKFNRHRHKHKVEEEKKKNQDDLHGKSKDVQSRLDAEDVSAASTSVQVVVDENAGPEELQKLHSIILSAVNSGQIAMSTSLPSQNVYHVTLTDQDLDQRVDLSAINLLANTMAEHFVDNE